MWEAKFDPILNQAYYISDDGSISFDLPCEVQNRKMQTSGIFNKISTKLSLMRSKSNSRDCLFRRNSRPSLKSSSSMGSQTLVNDGESADGESADGAALARTTSGLYFAEHNKWNAPMDSYLSSYQDDLSSVSSADSIQSFYSELPLDTYDDSSVYHLNREVERHELRQQFIRELY